MIIKNIVTWNVNVTAFRFVTFKKQIVYDDSNYTISYAYK